MNTINTTVRVQIYFYNALDQGLKSLEEFKAEDPMQLNNALLGLYARNLYHEVHSSFYFMSCYFSFLLFFPFLFFFYFFILSVSFI